MVLFGQLGTSVHDLDNPYCLLRAIEIDHRSFIKAALRRLDLEAIVCPVLALGDSLTLLQFAAYHRSPYTVRKLLRRPVDLDRQSMFQGYTALHIAAMGQNTGILTLLLELGADPNIRDKRGRTPIMSACAAGRLQAFETLLPHSDVRMLDDGGLCVLHMALRRATAGAWLELLLQHPVDVNTLDPAGEHPLHVAVRVENCQTTEMLLSRLDCSKNVLNSAGCNALHLACAEPSEPMIKLLLEHGVFCLQLNAAGSFPRDILRMHGVYLADLHASLIREEHTSASKAYLLVTNSGGLLELLPREVLNLIVSMLANSLDSCPESVLEWREGGNTKEPHRTLTLAGQPAADAATQQEHEGEGEVSR